MQNRVLVMTLLVAVIGISDIFAAPKDSLSNRKRTMLKIRSDFHPDENQTKKEAPILLVSEVPAETVSAPAIIVDTTGTGAASKVESEVNKNSENSSSNSEDKNKDKESGPVEIHVVDTLNVKPLSELVAENQSHDHDDSVKDKDAVSSVEVDHNKEDVNVTAPATVEETAVATPPKQPSYMDTIKNMLRHIFGFFGYRQKRKSRKSTDSPTDREEGVEVGTTSRGKNDDLIRYNEGVRATVGAILGRRECYKRAFCGAGRYLQDVKGKEVLIVLMEKFVPRTWMDTVNHIRDAAIYNDPCDYQCLED